ncbi:hypothetical protein KUF69_01315, partial [Streptomyces sp. BV129]|nr:hypothetical protein [Streptomyces sp. BV129]
LGGAPAGGGRLTGGPGQRGQVGSGQGPRAALPGAGQNGGRSGGARGPQGPGAFQQNQQNRPAPSGSGQAGPAGQAPGAPQGMHTANPGGPQQDAFGGRGPAQQPQRAGAGAEQGRQPQLPPRGGPRAELPGGNPQSRASLDVPRGHDEQDPSQTSRMPRIDDRQGMGGTAEMPRVDAHDPSATGGFPRQDLYGGGDQQQHTGQFARPGANGAQNNGQFQRPGANDPQNMGQYQQPGAQNGGGYGRQQQGGDEYTRSDLFGGPQGQQAQQNTGQFPVQQGYDAYQGGNTGQHALPGRPAQHQNGSQAAQNPAHTGQFEQQRPAAPQRPTRPEAGSRGPARQAPGDNWALPPAPAGTPGDGRTPLYDTLETNWFQQEQQQQSESAPAPQQPQAQAPTPAPQQSQSTTGSWRTSPNDELVRQAERVRQPAAGGVTTSGLPRRVPKANLVPGTAQQQQHHSGPQVSRAPDDVRGRLTNLRRGIAQGRQAGGGQTGSFPSPTHQQER